MFAVSNLKLKMNEFYNEFFVVGGVKKMLGTNMKLGAILQYLFSRESFGIATESQ